MPGQNRNEANKNLLKKEFQNGRGYRIMKHTVHSFMHSLDFFAQTWVQWPFSQNYALASLSPCLFALDFSNSPV